MPNEPLDGTTEFAIQFIKIFLGFILGVFVVVILLHLNARVNVLINQQAEIIRLMK